MLVKTLTVGQLDTNCYVVTDEQTLGCVVIDPGAESNTILEYIESNKLHCLAILVTHAHFDHITALPAVHRSTGAKVYVCPKDVGLNLGSAGRGYTPPEGWIPYGEGDVINFDGLEFHVLETPGHTPGGVCLICGDALFSGDTLFRGSCGRTDFDGGDLMEELRSLKKLAELPGEYDVFPGHDLSSTLSRERAHNPYMLRA
ncbi:MAG: MBL fold metallo-hydrolase, partial [Oscillospiraceae bacterium]